MDRHLQDLPTSFNKEFKETKMIRIEQFRRTDFDRLISWIDNEELLVQFAGSIFKFPLTKEQLEIYIDDKNRFVFKIVDQSTNETIGHAEIYLVDGKVAKLCRILIGEQKFRGQGLGQEIVNQLVDFSFGKLGASMAELNVYDWNISAMKCYQKAGFKINPNKRSTIEVNGNTWTSLNMKLDKAQWQQSH